MHEPTEEQRAISDFVASGKGNLLVEALAGSGKCLGRGTPILLFDGRVVPVELVARGDLLMGPNSEPRRVLQTSRGRGPLYKITPVKGESWICNDVHVMVLAGTNYWRGQTRDVSLREHLAWCAERDQRPDRNWKLWRTGVEFSERPTPLDPYLAGLWLGDGKNGASSITNCEAEIVAYCTAIAARYETECIVTLDPKHNTNELRFRAFGLHEMRGVPRAERRNQVLDAVRELVNDAGEKFIPHAYLANARAVRLQLLAGLVDTDGFVANGGIEITAKSIELADGILFLARSLGLAAYRSIKHATIKSYGFEGYYQRIYISGDIDEIPCLVARRKGTERKQIKRVDVTGWDAESIGDGEFFGFTLDGDGRFLLGDFTVTHNTESILQAITCCPQRSILVCAFNKAIADEMLARLPKMPKTHAVHVKTFHAQGLAIIKANRPGIEVDKTATQELINVVASPGVSFPSKRVAGKLVRQFKETSALAAPTQIFIEAMGREYNIFGKLKDHEIAHAIDMALAAIALSLDLKSRTKIDFCDMVWLPVVLNLAPPSRYQAVFVDELQDISAPQLAMISKLMIPGGRFVGVGDRKQCHPAGTLIRTTNGDIPIERLDPSRHRIIPWQRKSQRSVGQRNFKVGSRSYTGPMLTISVAGEVVDATPNHRFLCRWAKRPNVCVTYLMYRKDRGFRVGWCQLFDKHGKLHFATRRNLERADAAWILKVHTKRTDASIYESILAAKYGLFTATFQPSNALRHRKIDAIRKIFDGVDHDEQSLRAQRCLFDHGRDILLPFLPRPGQAPRDGDGRPTYFQCYASNLIPELMAIPLPIGVNKWVPIDLVESRPFGGQVYSLDVDIDHNYTANGLVVLNCIYGWRGAIGAATWEHIRTELKAEVLPLTISFRCSEAVVKDANRIVPQLRPWRDAPPGSVSRCTLKSLPSRVGKGFADKPHTFVLSRTNADLLDVALYLWTERVPFQLKAGADLLEPILDLVDEFDLRTPALFRTSVEKWSLGQLTKAEVLGSATWADMIEEQVKMLLSVVGFVQPRQIKSTLLAMLQPLGAGVLLSTVHKVKGLEADRVFLLEQTFKAHDELTMAPEYRPAIPEEELNILYVAITRARDHLVYVDMQNDAGAGADDDTRALGVDLETLSFKDLTALFEYVEQRAVDQADRFGNAVAEKWFVRAQAIETALAKVR